MTFRVVLRRDRKKILPRPAEREEAEGGEDLAHFPVAATAAASPEEGAGAVGDPAEASGAEWDPLDQGPSQREQR